MALYEQDEHPLGTLEERREWSVWARGAGGACVGLGVLFTFVGLANSGTSLGILADMLGGGAAIWGGGVFIFGDIVHRGVQREARAQQERIRRLS